IFFMATTVIVGEEWFLGAGLTRQAPHEAREGAGADEAQEDPFEMPPPRFTLRLSVGEGGTVVSGLGEPAIVGSPGAMDAWAERALAGLDRSSLVILVAPAPDVPYE